MERPTDSELLKACVARMGSRLEPAEERTLETSTRYFDDLCLRATRPDFSFQVHP